MPSNLWRRIAYSPTCAVRRWLGVDGSLAAYMPGPLEVAHEKGKKVSRSIYRETWKYFKNTGTDTFAEWIEEYTVPNRLFCCLLLSW